MIDVYFQTQYQMQLLMQIKNWKIWKISFANLLYKIDLDDNDKRLLYKTFKGNKKMLSALNMKKKEFKIDILNAVEEALLYSYK